MYNSYTGEPSMETKDDVEMVDDETARIEAEQAEQEAVQQVMS
jgi:hypothetical protein